MVIHRGGSYNSGMVGASPTYRGHAGKDNRSSMGEGFRIAESIADGADQSTEKKTAFETDLGIAQAAERARRTPSAAKPK